MGGWVDDLLSSVFFYGPSSRQLPIASVFAYPVLASLDAVLLEEARQSASGESWVGAQDLNCSGLLTIYVRLLALPAFCGLGWRKHPTTALDPAQRPC
jgi:hypothetical protein